MAKIQTKEKDGGNKVLLRNKRARHEYFIEETIEAGIVLMGSEVKSLRAGRAELTDAYAAVVGNEAFLNQMQISEYAFANQFGHAPKRVRKLLLHRKEIQKLNDAVHRAGYTLLPLEVYLKAGKIKVLLGVAKGKQQHDKRQDQREREAKVDMARHRH
jgi:SsrA-binding protein